MNTSEPESDKSQQQPPIDRPKNVILAFFWDYIWDRKTAKTTIEKEWHHAKHFPLLLMSVALVAIVCTASVLIFYFGNKISYVSGQLANSEKDKQTIQHASDGKDVQIGSLKQDYNEKLREKDAEIQKVTAEKDNALLRVSQLQSLPETAFLAYSNASIIGRLKSEQIYLMPVINGKPLTNYVVKAPLGEATVVPATTNREISIYFPPLADDEKPMVDLTIRLILNLDVTNISQGIAPGHWELDKTFSPHEGYTVLQIRPQSWLTSEREFSCTSIQISTNFTAPFLQAGIEMFCPNLRGVSKYVFVVTFPQ